MLVEKKPAFLDTEVHLPVQFASGVTRELDGRGYRPMIEHMRYA